MRLAGVGEHWRALARVDTVSRWSTLVGGPKTNPDGDPPSGVFRHHRDNLRPPRRHEPGNEALNPLLHHSPA